MRKAGLIFLLALVAFPCAAQGSESDWSNLQKLNTGDRIEIVLKSKAKHSGALAMLADDAITVRVGSAESGYRKDDVARVPAWARGDAAARR